MTRSRLYLLSFTAVILLIGAVILGWRIIASHQGAQDVQAAAQSTEKPVRNWVVCKDMGTGSVPGLGDQRQRFELCHPKGWMVLVYGLEPDRPAPPIGSTCILINKATFNCGVGVQTLIEYAVLVVPPAQKPGAQPAPTQADENPPEQPTPVPPSPELPTQAAPQTQPSPTAAILIPAASPTAAQPAIKPKPQKPPSQPQKQTVRSQPRQAAARQVPRPGGEGVLEWTGNALLSGGAFLLLVSLILALWGRKSAKNI